MKSAAIERLADSQCLLAGGRYASAISLALYALEISLKVRLCERLDLDALPKPFEIHELDELLLLCGLKNRLDDPIFSGVKTNWGILVTGVARHVNDLRYLPGSSVTKAQAEDLLFVLNDPVEGILTWLQNQP